ncbi:hypothetical protein CWE08_07095 [Aliidiomarina iranensis]|uniref:PepSY domain-containing protein n=1 Tax=Aliidiomarina iranensis TaxID=1434071 RepID=A0A432VW80_9GAMM|nr:PepSY domain-containing protein [Aliidiomarina iranensis]RUO20860.1 hypothetical protein CWE08_07095 [Aliidiomarina iranensis]
MSCLRVFCSVFAMVVTLSFATSTAQAMPNTILNAMQNSALLVLAEQERVPPQQIQEYLEKKYYGRMLTIELDNDDGLLIYEVTWLGNDDQIVEFHFNARTGELFWMKGINIRKLERDKP